MRSFVERWSSNRLVLVFMLMVTYSIQSLLVTASKIQGHFEYDVEAVVFLAELLKLCFAISMLPKDAWGSLCPTSSMIFALPGLLYSIQNRLVFVALQHLLPPEYQLLNNMKLFTTSVCYRLVCDAPLFVHATPVPQVATWWSSLMPVPAMFLHIHCTCVTGF